MPPAAQTPAQLIAALPEPKRGEVSRLHTIIQSELPGTRAEVSSGMIGYGKFHYRYDSGREGDAFKVSLSSNKGGISIYVNAVDAGGYVAEQAAARLGKAKVGKSCIRVASLDDLSIAGLTEVLRKARVTPGAGEVGAAATPAGPTKGSGKVAVGKVAAGRAGPGKATAGKAPAGKATAAKATPNQAAARKAASAGARSKAATRKASPAKASPAKASPAKASPAKARASAARKAPARKAPARNRAR